MTIICKFLYKDHFDIKKLQSKTTKRVHLTMDKPTLTLGRPRVKNPSYADAANYYDDLTQAMVQVSHG